MDILTVFCEIDDFCQVFEPRFQQMLIGDGIRQRNKPGAMTLSEVMTLLVLFHLSGFRNLKTFYNGFVSRYLRAEFPRLSSYSRFVERQRDALLPLWCYLYWRRASCTGISFIDSTTLKVCQNLRIPRHQDRPRADNRPEGPPARGGDHRAHRGDRRPGRTAHPSGAGDRGCEDAA